MDLAIPKMKKKIALHLSWDGWLLSNMDRWLRVTSKTTKGPDSEPLDWTGDFDRVYKDIKMTLTETPALCLPDLSKPFSLYMVEKKE